MKRGRRRCVVIGKRGILMCFGSIAAAALVLFGGVASFPYLQAFLTRAAVVSAGFTLPDGCGDLLSYTLFSESSSAVTETVAEADTPENETDEFAGTAEDYIRPDNAGNIVRKQYTAENTSAYIPLAAGYIKNSTDHTAEEIAAAIANGVDFTVAEDGAPTVLIYHTHATECYEPVTRDFYLPDAATRSTDNSENMVRVGDAIAAELEAAGIGVIHDTTQHDYPSYNGSYDRSAVTIQSYLDQYPSICVVLDIHRDGIQTSDGTRIAPVAEINGKTAAQVMIISGCDSGDGSYPDYFENLSFAAAFQVQMESDYPGLTRPVMFAYRKYNQNLSTGGLLLEIGAHGNSLEEAVYAGELVGKSLAKLLTS